MTLSVPVPTINANDESVVVVRWHVTDGARVEAGAPLVDVETTKSVVTIEAPATGVARPLVAEGAEIAVGAEIARIEGAVAAAAGAVAEPAGAMQPRAVASAATVPQAAVDPAATPLPVGQAESGAAESAVRLSREAARLVQERGVDPAAPFPAAKGLVTSARLRAAWGEPAAERASGARVVPEANDGLRRERTPADKRAEIAALREGAAEGLRSSLSVYFDSAPVRVALAGAPGILAQILAAAARLVAQRPALAAWHEGGATVFHDAVHLGVAVDLGDGLRVVTLRDAAMRDAATLELMLAEGTLACQERRLKPEEASGSTFTVTDLSGMDVLHFEPLLNGRQSAILGIGGDARLPGHPMSLTLAFDHRVLTGRQAAEFLRELRAKIEGLAESAPAASEPEPAADASEAAAALPSCDRCGIGVAEYYARFGRAGLMQNYTRMDGSTGCVCHSCVALG